MLTSLIRFKITGKYSIDAGIFGPTEVRIAISIFLILEVIFRGSLFYIAIAACIVLFISNIIESNKLLHIARKHDEDEKNPAKD